MRKLLGLLLFLAIGCSSNKPTSSPIIIKKTQAPVKAKTELYNEIQWREFDASVLMRAKLQKKLVLVFMEYPGCDGCDVMKKTTLLDKDVVNIVNRYFIMVKVDGNERQDIAQAINEKGVYPSTICLAPDGTYLVGINGYMPPKSYMAALKAIVSVAKENGVIGEN